MTRSIYLAAGEGDEWDFGEDIAHALKTTEERVSGLLYLFEKFISLPLRGEEKLVDICGSLPSVITCCIDEMDWLFHYKLVEYFIILYCKHPKPSHDFYKTYFCLMENTEDFAERIRALNIFSETQDMWTLCKPHFLPIEEAHSIEDLQLIIKQYYGLAVLLSRFSPFCFRSSS
eukprot:UN01563